MLLPRSTSPSRAARSQLPLPGNPHTPAPSRRSQQTIDDPELRAELAEALLVRPFEFLFLASRTLSVVGSGCPALVHELEAAGYEEGIALAAALCWLDGACGPPPSANDYCLPRWLAQLDRARLVDASRRRDGPNHSVSNCLLEVELRDGAVGTLHARIDHANDGVLIDAFVADDSLASIRRLFRVADRWRRDVGDGSSPPRPFRRIQPATAQRAIAGGLASTEGIDQPLNLTRPWPENRALVAFLVNNPDLVRP